MIDRLLKAAQALPPDPLAERFKAKFGFLPWKARLDYDKPAKYEAAVKHALESGDPSACRRPGTVEYLD